MFFFIHIQSINYACLFLYLKDLTTHHHDVVSDSFCKADFLCSYPVLLLKELIMLFFRIIFSSLQPDEQPLLFDI